MARTLPRGETHSFENYPETPDEVLPDTRADLLRLYFGMGFERFRNGIKIKKIPSIVFYHALVVEVTTFTSSPNNMKHWGAVWCVRHHLYFKPG